MKPLTERQAAILKYMEDNAVTVYPTVRKIAAHFDVYPATIQDHIDALKRKGALPQGKRQKRLQK